MNNQQFPAEDDPFGPDPFADPVPDASSFKKIGDQLKATLPKKPVMAPAQVVVNPPKIEAAVVQEESQSDTNDKVTQPIIEVQKHSDMQIAVQNKTQLVAGDSGVLVGKTLDEQWRIAQMYLKARVLPQSFDTPEKVLVGMQLCYELGLKPLTAMRQIAVINGSASIFGDLPLALVRNSGQLEYFFEELFDESGKTISRQNGNISAEVFGAACIVKRKGGEKHEVIFTKKDAMTAKVWGTKVWAVYPKRMLQMRARSQALKDQFSDVIHGCAIGEYDHNQILETVTEATATQTTMTGGAAKLNELLDG